VATAQHHLTEDYDLPLAQVDVARIVSVSIWTISPAATFSTFIVTVEEQIYAVSAITFC